MPSRILAAVCVLGLLSASVSAQEFRGTLSGRVTDPSGSVIPNVKVTAINNDTGARFETTTTDTGEYTLPFLIPGPYRLTVDAEGFKTYVQERVQVGTNQRVSQDIALQIGASTESVTVTADAALVSATTASVGQVITTHQIENLPMNGRTPLSLAQLSFGVTPNSDPRFTRPFDNSGPSGFSMGGGQSQSNELLLDGTPDMTRNRRVAYNPPVDAVSEIKVEAFQPDAAYGNTGGGTVNVVMRGGTNEFHGSVYEFNQVSALKATPWFTRIAGQRKSVTRFNQYGVSAGGPVWIPKIVNGRNRLFWFYSFEGIRQSEPEPLFSTVPTAEQRRGDFSALLRLGPSYTIYDPMTGTLQGGSVRRTAFQNNVIPPNRLNPIAQSILDFVPLPNQPGVVGENGYNGTNNYFNNSVRSDRFSGHMGRLDFNASDRNKMFWNFRFNDRLEDRSDRFGNDITGNYLTRTNWGTTFDDVHTFTPTLLFNVRFGWTRFIEANTRQSTGFDPTSLGLPGYVATNSSRLLFPRIDFGQITDLSDSGGDYVPFDTFQIFGALTKVAGGHTLKFGTDLRRQIESSNGFGNSVGQYTFATNWTNPGTGQASAPLGQDIAAFLLGLPTGGNFDVNATRTNQAYYYAFFVQDDWRVRSNFSLNLGLRYERETGTVERFNRTIVGFDPAAINRVSEAARAAYAANPNSPINVLPASRFNPTGGIIFASEDHRHVYSTSPWAFSPRLGFSWSPWGANTVLRGGAGVFYNTYGTFGIQQPGFSQSTPIAITDNFLNPQAAPTLANPFPQGIQRPVGAANGINTYLGQSFRFTNPDLQQPFLWRWSFNIQRALGSNIVTEIGYMGSRGAHLAEGDTDLNYVPAEYLSTSPVRDQAAIDRLARVVPNPFAGLLPGTGLNGATTTVEQLVRPYPQFSGSGGVSTNSLNLGRSWFHMLQARVEKRYSNGFNLLANFQWSKMIEELRRLNPSDPLLEHRIADEDRPLRLVLSGSYELPFGRGKAVGSGVGGFWNALIGGWQFNAIYIAQSGSPINWESRNAIYYGGDLNLDSHPEMTELGAPVFDITRFERAANRQLDRNIRTFGSRFGNLRADRISNLDASLIKNVNITERVVAQFRAEMFNALNRATYNEPDTNPTSGNFGRITSAANLPRALQLALRIRW
jgi:hypothetical protein